AATRPPVDSKAAGSRTAKPNAAATPVKTASKAEDEGKAGVALAVGRLERAIASAKVQEMKTVYPGLSTKNEKDWQDFLKGKKNLVATFKPGNIKVKDQNADATFEMHLAYTDGTGAQKNLDWNAEGKLEKVAAGWVWKTLTLRR